MYIAMILPVVHYNGFVGSTLLNPLVIIKQHWQVLCEDPSCSNGIGSFYELPVGCNKLSSIYLTKCDQY